jgi:hypothetical protein
MLKKYSRHGPLPSEHVRRVRALDRIPKELGQQRDRGKAILISAHISRDADYQTQKAHDGPALQ